MSFWCHPFDQNRNDVSIKSFRFLLTFRWLLTRPSLPLQNSLVYNGHLLELINDFFLPFRKPWRNDSNPTIIATNACTLPIWSGCLQIAEPTTLRKRNTTTAPIISKNMLWANSGITDSWLEVFSQIFPTKFQNKFT